MINSFQARFRRAVSLAPAAATWADPAGDHRATTGWSRCPDLSGMSLAQATAALQVNQPARPGTVMSPTTPPSTRTSAPARLR